LLDIARPLMHAVSDAHGVLVYLSKVVAASRHNALSYERAGKIEAQLRAEVAELLAKAEPHDSRTQGSCREV
jgi:hypothetical protein